MKSIEQIRSELIHEAQAKVFAERLRKAASNKVGDGWDEVRKVARAIESLWGQQWTEEDSSKKAKS